MNEITDADREIAAEILERITEPVSGLYGVERAIAQALADQRAQLTTEYAIEFHYVEGEDGWRIERNEDGRDRIWPDREVADRELTRRRQHFGNGGRDWARLVTRTVTPWEQVED